MQCFGLAINLVLAGIWIDSGNESAHLCRAFQNGLPTSSNQHFILGNTKMLSPWELPLQAWIQARVIPYSAKLCSSHDTGWASLLDKALWNQWLHHSSPLPSPRTADTFIASGSARIQLPNAGLEELDTPIAVQWELGIFLHIPLSGHTPFPPPPPPPCPKLSWSTWQWRLDCVHTLICWVVWQKEANPSYLPQRRALGRCNTIAFGVQVTSHLHGVTGLPLLDVLIHGGLQEVGILPFGLPHPDHPLFCRPHKNGGLSWLHVRPHLLKHCYFGSLRGTAETQQKS